MFLFLYLIELSTSECNQKKNNLLTGRLVQLYQMNVLAYCIFL